MADHLGSAPDRLSEHRPSRVDVGHQETTDRATDPAPASSEDSGSSHAALPFPASDPDSARTVPIPRPWPVLRQSMGGSPGRRKRATVYDPASCRAHAANFRRALKMPRVSLHALLSVLLGNTRF